jgi:flagellar basal-body rod protein FlgF
MPYGLYISAEGAQAQSKRLEVLANNLANVDTPGFKRDLAIFQARYAEETKRGLDYPGSRSINDVGGGIWVRGTATDFAPGSTKRTGIPTDMTINGDGFFVVRKGNRDLLTRAGNFQLNANGRLVTQDGDPVLDDSNSPIDIDPEAGPWQLTPDGGIAQDGAVTYLNLVRPRSMGDLAKVGDNLFASLAPLQQVESENRQIAAGFLEMSDVKPTLEMMDLIEASRGFEANVNMIRNQDQMIGALVNRVLKPAA